MIALALFTFFSGFVCGGLAMLLYGLYLVARDE